MDGRLTEFAKTAAQIVGAANFKAGAAYAAYPRGYAE